MSFAIFRIDTLNFFHCLSKSQIKLGILCLIWQSYLWSPVNGERGNKWRVNANNSQCAENAGTSTGDDGWCRVQAALGPQTGARPSPSRKPFLSPAKLPWKLEEEPTVSPSLQASTPHLPETSDNWEEGSGCKSPQVLALTLAFIFNEPFSWDLTRRQQALSAASRSPEQGC